MAAPPKRHLPRSRAEFRKAASSGLEGGAETKRPISLAHSAPAELRGRGAARGTCQRMASPVFQATSAGQPLRTHRGRCGHQSFSEGSHFQTAFDPGRKAHRWLPGIDSRPAGPAGSSPTSASTTTPASPLPRSCPTSARKAPSPSSRRAWPTTPASASRSRAS